GGLPEKRSRRGLRARHVPRLRLVGNVPLQPEDLLAAARPRRTARFRSRVRRVAAALRAVQGRGVPLRRGGLRKMAGRNALALRSSRLARAAQVQLYFALPRIPCLRGGLGSKANNETFGPDGACPRGAND